MLMPSRIHEPKIPAERGGLRLLFKVRRDLLGYFVNLMRQEGAFAWLSLGGKNVLMLNDATAIQHVLKDNAAHYHKSHFYNVLKPFLGNSMLLTEGDLWRRQRQETTPIFTTRNFETMVPEMVAATETMLQRWQESAQAGKSIDLNFETMNFTLDILLRTLFHESRDGVAGSMQTAITTLLREAEERIWSPISLPHSVLFRLPHYRNALDFLNTTMQELVAARRANQAYPEDLLSRLVTRYGTSPKEQALLRDQVMTFLLAGHETTANGLLWACYYLSLYPDVLRKVAQEADTVLQQGSLTLASLKDLPYMRQVFDEVLRIRPIVWTLSRDAMQDDLIPLEDGSFVRAAKGTVVMTCAYAVHRRDCYWQNPEAFDPERFTPEQEQTRPRFAYFPFGGGPRQCLGFRFAQIESIIALAMIAQRYRLALVPGQDVQHLPNITLRPKGPIHFSLTERAATQHKKSPTPQPAEPNKPATCPFHRPTETQR